MHRKAQGGRSLRHYCRIAWSLLCLTASSLVHGLFGGGRGGGVVGPLSQVFRGVLHGTDVAIKKLKASALRSDTDLEALRHEIAVMRSGRLPVACLAEPPLL